MPRLAVVFDTNTYRALGGAAVPELRALERSRSVVACAHFVAAQELLTHVADPADADYGSCRSALRAMWAHCSLYSGWRYYTSLVPVADASLSINLFGRALPDIDAHFRMYDALIRRAGQASTNDALAEYQATLKKLAARSAALKESFLHHFERHALEPFGGNATSWAPLAGNPEALQKARAFYDSESGVRELAITRVKMVAEHLGISLTEDEVADRSAMVFVYWRTPLEYFNALVRSVVVDGLKLSTGSKANALWDYEIAWSISRYINVNGVPVLFVTDDQRIHRAAQAGGDSAMVTTLVDYRTALRENTLPDLATH